LRSTITPVIAAAVTAAIVITLFPPDIPIQAIQAPVDPVTFVRTEATVILHGVDHHKDVVQFPFKPERLFVGKRATSFAPLDFLMGGADPGTDAPAPIPTLMVTTPIAAITVTPAITMLGLR
jgi:hypothetical protein